MKKKLKNKLIFLYNNFYKVLISDPLKILKKKIFKYKNKLKKTKIN